MSQKLKKSEVDYHSSMGAKYCGICNMYRIIKGESGECTLVEGPIKKWDVCDRWEPEK